MALREVTSGIEYILDMLCHCSFNNKSFSFNILAKIFVGFNILTETTLIVCFEKTNANLNDSLLRAITKMSFVEWCPFAC